VTYGLSGYSHEITVNMFLMFTGVEIQRCSGGSELRVVRHKSISYSMGASYMPIILS
jgi:hypothetical protein